MTTPQEPTDEQQQLCRAAHDAYRRGGEVPHDDATQMALLRSYLYGRYLSNGASGRKSAKKRALIAAGECSLGALMKSLDGLLWSCANRVSRQRSGGRSNKPLAEELYSEAVVAVLEAMGSYSPSSNPSLSGWVSRVADRALDGCETTSSFTGAPRIWRKVYNAAMFIQSNRAVGAHELPDALEAHFADQARAAIAPNDLPSGADLEQVVRDKLTRSGVYQALARLPEVMETMGGLVSIDEDFDDDRGRSDTTVGRSLTAVPVSGSAANLTVMLDGLRFDDEQIVRKRFDRSHVKVHQVAQECGVDPGAVRAATRHVKNRLVAPHAQFARMAPEVTVCRAGSPSVTDTAQRIAAGRERAAGALR